LILLYCFFTLLLIMSLQLEIITPAKIVFNAQVKSVVLPTPTGELGILTGHLPLVTPIDPGEIRLETDAGTQSLAVDRGFAKVAGNDVVVITEAAIDVAAIDLSMLEAAESRAQQALLKAKEENADPAEFEHFESVARFAVAQRLAAGRRRR
jgi:F-type H+-transporting ATPase subunit epsilon